MKELNVIQCELHAPKAKQGYGYKFRNVEDIMEAVKPLLKKTGCVMNVSDEIVAVGSKIYLKAVATIINGAGETMSSDGWAEEPATLSNMSKPQITGSISSYARKYALCGLFAIDGTEQSLEPVVEVESATGNDVVEKAVRDINNCQSRQQFEELQRTYKDYLKNERVKAACITIAKKYPKK